MFSISSSEEADVIPLIGPPPPRTPLRFFLWMVIVSIVAQFNLWIQINSEKNILNSSSLVCLHQQGATESSSLQPIPSLLAPGSVQHQPVVAVGASRKIGRTLSSCCLLPTCWSAEGRGLVCWLDPFREKIPGGKSRLHWQPFLPRKKNAAATELNRRFVPSSD